MGARSKQGQTLITHGSAFGKQAKLADKAISLRESGKSVIVFARTVKDVTTITERIGKQKLSVATLTGTMRGKEREGLIKEPAFVRFLPESNRPQEIKPTEGTVYLVCSSAGEVGVNISAVGRIGVTGHQ